MTKYTIESSRTWYNNLPPKRTSAGLIVRNKGKILMIKDDYKNGMTFPSGAIDENEGAKPAALRETREEAGLVFSADNVTFFTVVYVPERDGFKDCFHFFFIVETGDSDIDADMHTEAGIEYHSWVDPSEIGMLSGNRPIYRELGIMLATNTQIPYIEVKE